MKTIFYNEKRRIKLVSIAKYVSGRKVYAKEVAEKIGADESWVAEAVGVKERYYVDPKETSISQMAAEAAKIALQKAGMKPEDLDLIISTSGVLQQAIPCTAAFVQRHLGLESVHTPCFDINSTCLSFLTGLDTISTLIQSGRYKNVLVTSADIASVGLNWNHKESAALFGDGAAAAIFTMSEEDEDSCILSSAMETYSQGIEFCEIVGGGTRAHPREHLPEETIQNFLFEMHGPKVFRLASKVLPQFIKSLLEAANLTLEDINLVVPHQASKPAMDIVFRRRLGLEDDKIASIVSEYGNCIAASLPMALADSIEKKKIKRGDKALLIGVSAGVSIGGITLIY